MNHITMYRGNLMIKTVVRMGYFNVSRQDCLYQLSCDNILHTNILITKEIFNARSIVSWTESKSNSLSTQY